MDDREIAVICDQNVCTLRDAKVERRVLFFSDLFPICFLEVRARASSTGLNRELVFREIPTITEKPTVPLTF